MTLSSNLYPAGPETFPARFIRPSPAFRRQVIRVLLAILLFFMVYLLLVLLAMALAAAAVYGGLALIVNLPRAITIMLGIGLIGLGAMVFFFMVKFIFARSRQDMSSQVQVKEAEQPRLFAFLRQLTHDTRTPMPGKLFFTPDVNASVSYNSSFWSMFLPVRKNLRIGLGLVNAVNTSEFKAILAHEFGHFSQRSMKLGSFVYQVNRVLYNMLFENSGYSRSLQQWAAMSSYFSFFAAITAYIVRGIQQVLRVMYGLINRLYLGLSREMEFHADAVAASVAGGNNLITALRRVELANGAYQITLSKCGEWYRQNLVSQNIYLNQQAVTRKLALDYRLNWQDGLPDLSAGGVPVNQSSRIYYKDQWASHPGQQEREAHLNEMDAPALVNSQPAWVLFQDVAEWQERLTEKVYGDGLPAEGLEKLDGASFEKRLEEELARNDLPAEYQGYFDGREIERVELSAIIGADEAHSKADPSLFLQPPLVDIPRRIRSLEADIATLKAIDAGEILIKTYDFDGEKYPRREAGGHAAALEAEREQLEAELKANDKMFFVRICAAARQAGEEQARAWQQLYEQYSERRREAEPFFALLERLLGALHPIFSGQSLNLQNVQMMLTTLKEEHEPEFKSWLVKWQNAGAFDADRVFTNNIKSYLNTRYAYFDGQQFIENELMELNNLTRQSWILVKTFEQEAFRKLLQHQLPLLKP